MLGLPEFPYYSPLLRGTRRANHLRRNWPKAIIAANLHEGEGRKVRVPRLSHVEITGDEGQEITALVDMATVGGTALELQKRLETVTASLHAFSSRLERIDPAHARLIINFEPPRRPSPSSLATNVPYFDLEQIPIPLDHADTAQASVYLTKSILIGGESESGKSNLVWYLLSQLNDLGIPYRLWVIDPAGGVELSDLEHSPLTRKYADRIGDIPDLVQGFRESLDHRLARMKSTGARRHFPTQTEPVEICLIDEILLCKSQLKGGDADSPLGEVLASGRKALHIVVACSQLGQKDVIGQIRDLFPQRICLRTRSQEATDAILGSRATADGAQCDRITRRGEGYVFTDISETFEKFQAPLVRETQNIAQGGTTAPTLPLPSTRTLRRRAGRHFGYVYYDTQPNHPNSQRPCYVGITDNPRKREKQHEREWPKHIWATINHSRTKRRTFPNYEAAKEWETQMITYYQPIYNVQETR